MLLGAQVAGEIAVPPHRVCQVGVVAAVVGQHGRQPAYHPSSSPLLSWSLAGQNQSQPAAGAGAHP